ncbi:MIF-like protein mif-2 [Littorina saxatilis]|uniref:D-dopachrome decarboxylase n=1 Tax=Littorina saxatilis TaxID=31220 RepID=A0AAN9FYB5_9CAEN
MPMLFFNTNLKDKDIPADFERKLCEKVGEVLNKPIERITLTINCGLRQMRAGTPDPMVSLEIHSIDVFDKERNPTYSPPLLTFISESLKLPQKRVVILYHDLLAANVGQNTS